MKLKIKMTASGIILIVSIFFIYRAWSLFIPDSRFILMDRRTEYTGIDGIPVPFLRFGDGSRHILIIPDIFDLPEHWLPVAQAFRKQAAVTVVGMPNSPQFAFGSGKRIAAYEQMLYRFLQKTGWSEKIDLLVANGTGCRFAMSIDAREKVCINPILSGSGRSPGYAFYRRQSSLHLYMYFLLHGFSRYMADYGLHEPMTHISQRIWKHNFRDPVWIHLRIRMATEIYNAPYARRNDSGMHIVCTKDHRMTSRAYCFHVGSEFFGDPRPMEMQGSFYPHMTDPDTVVALIRSAPGH